MSKMRAKIITVGLLAAAILLPVSFAQANQVGHASWYALYSRTASGEQMNPSALTAAHRSLPFGTKVLVENLSNGRSVVVRINDRGPFVGGRIIDVSKGAASVLGMIGSGTAKVRVSQAGGGALAAAATTRKVSSTASDKPKKVAAKASSKKIAAKASSKKVAAKASSKKHLASNQRSRGKASLASRSSTKKHVTVASARKQKHWSVASKTKHSRAVAGRTSKGTGKGLFASTWNPNKLAKTRSQRRQG